MSLPWEERAALREQYPEFYVDLLLEVLGVVDAVELRHLSGTEATALAKSRFSALLWEHLPECRARVTAYQQRIATEQAELNKAAGEYEEKRVRARQAETIRIEREAEESQAEQYRSARESEERTREQWRENYDRMETERLKKNEEQRLSAEAAAKEAERLVSVIEKGGG